MSLLRIQYFSINVSIKPFIVLVLHFQFNKLKKVKADQENLPIFQYKSEIVDTVRENQVVIIAGDTGCGKSTQV